MLGCDVEVLPAFAVLRCGRWGKRSTEDQQLDAPADAGAGGFLQLAAGWVNSAAVAIGGVNALAAAKHFQISGSAGVRRAGFLVGMAGEERALRCAHPFCHWRYSSDKASTSFDAEHRPELRKAMRSLWNAMTSLAQCQSV
jgi:hypothetical protein